MANLPWQYAANQFLNSTIGSYKKMSILSPDHKARLEAEIADADILALFNAYVPFDSAYITAYTNWISAKGIYKGSTVALDNSLADLSANQIRQWDIQIQAVYLEGTPEYVAILPNGRGPFQTGGKDQRINEVQALATRLSNYAALSATQTLVQNFYNAIVVLRNDQQTKEMDVATKSQLVETARVNCSNQMYFNVGKLMAKYKTDPIQIERFWQLDLLRATGGDLILEGDIAGGDTDNILAGGFDDTTVFEITNTGTTNLRFFTATSPTATSTTGLDLAPGTSATKTALELGTSGNTFLNVTNLDANNQGSWKVEVV